LSATEAIPAGDVYHDGVSDDCWLEPDEWRLWHGLLRTWSLMSTELDRRLQEDSGLSLAEFDVLSYLTMGTPQGLRMYELGERVLASKTRLTHIVDRLEDAGLVVRRRDPDDARGVRVAMTARGRKSQAAAGPTYVEVVRTHLLGHFSATQAKATVTALDKARASLGDCTQVAGADHLLLTPGD
jgi:DNA-binding MarR family transcriptional regulator